MSDVVKLGEELLVDIDISKFGVNLFLEKSEHKIKMEIILSQSPFYH